MELSTLSEILKVGGPGALFAVLFFLSHRMYLSKVLEALENNTKVLTELCTIVKERLK